MAIKMVREPNETPNINNIDDIVPMRYAYGNQNGYVIGKGTEISNTVNGLNFTINSGRLVLQGVECDIDASGVTITIDNIATKRYYVIYLEVNLGLNSATIKSEYDTATYPSIDTGDDLTENTTGVARLPLYRFTATSGIISDVYKVVESIGYINPNSIIDKAMNLVFNGKGGVNEIIFNTFDNFLEFVISDSFDLSQILKLEIIFKNDISYRIDRLAIRSTGLISYSKLIGLLRKGISHTFIISEVTPDIHQMTMNNIGDKGITTLKMTTNGLFITAKHFSLFRDQTTSSYQVFNFDFTSNDYTTKIDENNYEQIKLVYFVPQKDE